MQASNFASTDLNHDPALLARAGLSASDRTVQVERAAAPTDAIEAEVATLPRGGWSGPVAHAVEAELAAAPRNSWVGAVDDVVQVELAALPRSTWIGTAQDAVEAELAAAPRGGWSGPEPT